MARVSLQELVDKLYSFPEENAQLKALENSLIELRVLSGQVAQLLPEQETNTESAHVRK